jgi:hypothetical protein
VHHAAHYVVHGAADRANWTAGTTRIVSTAPATTAVLMVGLAGLRRAFAQQRLVLRGVEEARHGIGVLLLPARDGVAGRVVELSVDLGAEPESRQTALHSERPST